MESKASKQPLKQLQDCKKSSHKSLKSSKKSAGKTEKKPLTIPQAFSGYKVYEDKPTTEEDAVSLMCSEKPSERYWEVRAEQRRAALEDALDENERLHKRIKLLEEEQGPLRVLAEKALYFADVLTEILGEEEPALAEEISRLPPLPSSSSDPPLSSDPCSEKEDEDVSAIPGTSEKLSEGESDVSGGEASVKDDEDTEKADHASQQAETPVGSRTKALLGEDFKTPAPASSKEDSGSPLNESGYVGTPEPSSSGNTQ